MCANLAPGLNKIISRLLKNYAWGSASYMITDRTPDGRQKTEERKAG